jgi:hypothetical protein
LRCDLSDSSWTEEERPECTDQPVAQREVRRPLARAAQDEQLLLEQEVFRDHRSHATGATQPRGHDGEVKQSEQEFLHARDSVGQEQAPRNVAAILVQRERIGISRPTASRRSLSRKEPPGGFCLDPDAPAFQ